MELDYRDHSLVELAKKVNSRELSAEELIKASLKNIEDVDKEINAFCSINPELSIKEAKKVDERISKGENLPLGGLALGVKDLEDAEGYVTAYGSDFHTNDQPAKTDSILVKRLRAAGAIVVGKTNTPEFGYKGVTDNVPFGASKNPWNKEFTPGGSSGGSSAALAAGMVPITTGSDGGGSIRIPAALCGLSAIKTSQGRVPNGGQTPPGSGILTVKGPMTNKIDEAAYSLDNCIGPESSDIFSLPKPKESWYENLNADLPERIIWTSTFGFADVDKEIKEKSEEAISKIESAGCEVIRDEEIWKEDPVSSWLVFWTGARGRAQGHLRGTPDWERIDADLRPQIEWGMDNFSAADYAAAFDQCHYLSLKLEERFQKAPLILSPATCGLTPKIYEQGIVNGEETPAWVAFTYGINMTRNPAGTFPIGLSTQGLPIGIQVIGSQQDDLGVLQGIKNFENIMNFNIKAS